MSPSSHGKRFAKTWKLYLKTGAMSPYYHLLLHVKSLIALFANFYFLEPLIEYEVLVRMLVFKQKKFIKPAMDQLSPFLRHPGNESCWQYLYQNWTCVLNRFSSLIQFPIKVYNYVCFILPFPPFLPFNFITITLKGFPKHNPQFWQKFRAKFMRKPVRVKSYKIWMEEMEWKESVKQT